ncbi:MAG: hypothetical protein AAGJ34_13220 [Pseudomonadota bacterium]
MKLGWIVLASAVTLASQLAAQSGIEVRSDPITEIDAKYRSYCNWTPEQSFRSESLDINGDSIDDHVIVFSEACQGSITFFFGTGGTPHQLWLSREDGESYRLALETVWGIYTFAPNENGTLNIQVSAHGGHCGGVIANTCNLIYHVSGDQAEVVSRNPIYNQ